MQTATRRRKIWAIAASIMVHLAAGFALLSQRPTAVTSEPVISVLLVTRPPPVSGANAPRPTALRLHRPPQEAPPPEVPSAPIAPPAASGANAPSPPAGAGAAAGPDLRLALRHGVLGCANSAGMSRADRERCDEQLGRGAAQVPAMAIALEPRIRAYYDAVAVAKTGVTGHLPLIGCKIPFGPGKPRKLPSHWLTLGPCFIAPPKGSLTPEADITPPDQDMNKR
jgi:hypothetical protein